MYSEPRLLWKITPQRGLYDLTELCARNRISRKTGYEQLARYAAEGARGLVERSKRRTRIHIAWQMRWRRCSS